VRLTTQTMGERLKGQERDKLLVLGKKGKEKREREEGIKFAISKKEDAAGFWGGGVMPFP